MSMTLSGNGTITGLVSGGLPDGTITQAEIASEAVGFSKLLSTDWSVSKTGSGYQKLPTGIIIQWGNTYFNSSGSAAITFPVAFPNSCLFVNASVWRGSTLSGYLMSTQIGTYTASGATIIGNYTIGGSVANLGGNETAAWIAIGY